MRRAVFAGERNPVVIAEPAAWFPLRNFAPGGLGELQVVAGTPPE